MRNIIFPLVKNNFTVLSIALTLAACATNAPNGIGNANNNVMPGAVVAEDMTGRSQYATLANLSIDNRGNKVITKPSQIIQASTNYSYHCGRCNPAANNQILVGLAGRSAQACIYDGGNNSSGTANFNIKTPAVPGNYEIRFRSAQAANCQEALKTWWSLNGTPGQAATIGKIRVVKLKG